MSASSFTFILPLEITVHYEAYGLDYGFDAENDQTSIREDALLHLTAVVTEVAREQLSRSGGATLRVSNRVGGRSSK